MDITDLPISRDRAAEEREAEAALAAPRGSVACRVIKELNQLRDWIKDGSGYNRDDAPDEIARAIANRIREIEATETSKPLNDEVSDRADKDGGS